MAACVLWLAASAQYWQQQVNYTIDVTLDDKAKALDGFEKITYFNKFDNSLRMSQIFGNTLEAVVGAVYLDKGFKKTKLWVMERIILPHLFMDDLEALEINHKNKLYGWANKNGKNLEFETLDERLEGGRRLFTVGAVVDGTLIAQGKAYNKKDASQIAAQIAVDKLGLIEKVEE